MTVRGDASIRAEPDEALVWVTLSALSDAPGSALSDVAARSSTLVGLLDELGVGTADRSTTGITVHEDFDHTQTGRRSLGHRANACVAVRLSDPEVLGRLVVEATDRLAARIDGPSWRIAADNPVRLEAAKQAAADGRRKAQAYAEGVDAKLGRLIQLVEPGLGNATDAELPRRALASASMPVERGEHEVAASIQVTFALEFD